MVNNIQTRLDDFFKQKAQEIDKLFEIGEKNLYGIAEKFKEIYDEAEREYSLTKKQVYINLKKESKRMTIAYSSFVKSIQVINFTLKYPKYKQLPFGNVSEIANSIVDETDSIVDETDSIVDEIKDKTQSEVRKYINKKKKQKKTKQRKEKVKDIKIAQLIEGNCLEEIKKLKDNSIDCLITDPPYGIGFQSQHRTATVKHNKILQDDNTVYELLAKTLELISPKLKEKAHIYIFTSWKVLINLRPIINKYFPIKNILVWVKNNWSMGDLEGNYAEQYELILFCSKGKKELNFEEKRPTNVLQYDRVVSELHPTEKPVDLLKFLIKNSTVENETILDPFAGSGSTAIACIETKRNWILIEKELEYIDIIKERIKEGGKVR